MIILYAKFYDQFFYSLFLKYIWGRKIHINMKYYLQKKIIDLQSYKLPNYQYQLCQEKADLKLVFTMKRENKTNYRI